MKSGVPPAAEQVDGTAELPRRFSVRQKFVAFFVTWHLLAVLIYILPYPPYFDAATVALPETQHQLHLLFGTFKPLAPWWKTEQEMQDKVLAFVRKYVAGYFAVRQVVEPYLLLTGNVQAWNMFGGTPGRHPSVFQVEILPAGESQWVLFQDLNWGTKEYEATYFRHFEATANLAVPGWDQHRFWYAQYWARRWNRLHPERRAHSVRTYHLRLTTPTPAQVRAGDADRRPQKFFENVWQVLPEQQP
jgi:hypothetical protein